MRRLLTAIPLFVCLLYQETEAWHAKGHLAVAFVAYQQLTPPIKTRVQALLRRNPSFDQWQTRLEGVSDEDKPALLFTLAAGWADDIKRDHRYRNDGNLPIGPEAARNIGYRDKLQHRYWHFVDRPFSTDGTALEDPPTVNAQERIELFRATLASTTVSDAVKSYDLVWLAHLVGDVHQPLHCTSRFLAAFPQGDRGGNSVTLSCPGCGSELHGFWDGIVGETNRGTVAATFAHTLAAAPAAAANDTNVAHWITESFDFARSTVYLNPPIGVTAGPFAVTPTYRSNALDLGKQQIALAGARLAKLINDNLQ